MASDRGTHKVEMSARGSGSSIDLAWLSERINYRLFQECVHCGLCTASCPTYLETGNENDSPRGRIYLMRAVTDGRLPASDEVRSHLDLCLDCRACESACPSGVQYGRLIEPFKVAMHDANRVNAKPSANPLLDFILQHIFPYARRVKWALAPARWMKRLGLFEVAERTGVIAALPASMKQLVQALPQRLQSPRRLPFITRPSGKPRARVALFTGCVGDAMAPETNAATLRVLARNGCEVVVPREQVCCGAIHYHSGHEQPAMDFARKNMRVFEEMQCDAIVVNVAGCGAMLKEYHHLLPAAEREAAKQFESKVRDVSQFLDELQIDPPKHSLPIKLTYHDACHLCHAQQVRSAPRRLLESIPGMRMVPLEESEVCCGAAGTYNLTQPEMSQKLADRKAKQIIATGAQVVAMGNIGCQLQVERGLRSLNSDIEVVHTVELLDRAYSAIEPA